jgi:hypothetical protein
MESSNKFICHVRLKRSGAWWYEINSNQMLALRCANITAHFIRYLHGINARNQQRKNCLKLPSGGQGVRRSGGKVDDYVVGVANIQQPKSCNPPVASF